VSRHDYDPGIRIDMNCRIGYDSDKFRVYRRTEQVEDIVGKGMTMSEEIEHLQKNIEADLLSYGADIVGFADVADITIKHEPELQTAISVGIAYDEDIVRALDAEIGEFERHLRDTKSQIDVLLKMFEQRLQEEGYAVWVPPISKNLPGLVSDFSHKTAATKAGLGWIGKNALFVSPEFGCGLRLGTILTDAPLVTTASPVVESRCGACTECVNACPYGALKGENWYPGIERDSLVDAFLCSQKREEYIPILGFKHPCGLCIQACPMGART
jgi:epoxyqueuosine reductase QueG